MPAEARGTRTTSSFTSPIIATACGAFSCGRRHAGAPDEIREGGKHTTHRWPSFLPDGKHFLFFATNHSGNSEQGIYYGSLEDGSFRHVVDSESQGVYANGYLLYHLQSQLMAQKFDPANGKVSGDPKMVANFVEYDAGTWHTTFAASQNGLLVYEPGAKTLGTDLVWLDRSGKKLGRLGSVVFTKAAVKFPPTASGWRSPWETRKRISGSLIWRAGQERA